ncbi:MAG: mechanosensitive ion channel family protein [Planctomycetota bacterium]
MRRALTLVLLASVALAQAPKGPGHPRVLVERLMAEAERHAEGEDGALERAAALFELEDVNPADRESIGKRAATDLIQYLNRIEPPVAARDMPFEAKSPYAFLTEFGPIKCVQVEDGTWRFAKSTRQALPDLLDKVAEREARAGTDDVKTLRDVMPAWLRRKVLVLANWQWLGLLALALLGFIASGIGGFLFFQFAQRMARLRGTELKRGRKAGRPFGLVAMSATWWLGLDLLLLPEQAHVILVLVARLVLMVGVVWSLLRVIDWVAETAVNLARRTSSKFDDLLVPMVTRAVKVFVVALGIVWIADNLDMNIGALLAGLGIGGVALALAAKDTVANFFGAITVLADRPFEVGDWIVIGKIEGTIADVGFRSTRVRTFYDSVITFPNSMLITTAVDNFGRRKYRRLKFHVGLTYDTPADKIESFVEGVRELIRTHPYTRKDYYHVYFHGFSANSLDVLVYMFFDAPDWATELRERQRLLLDIKRVAEALDVGFAFPTRTIHMVQGEAEEHGEPAETLPDAWQRGRAAADGIVERYTGSGKPPPVRVGHAPDEDSGE